jgi:hypothetical protein
MQGGHAQGLTGAFLPPPAMVDQALVRLGFQLGAQGRHGFRIAKRRARARSVALGRQALARTPLE